MPMPDLVLAEDQIHGKARETAELMGLPLSPVHVAKRCQTEYTYAYPPHVRMMNEQIVDAILDREQRFLIFEIPVRSGKSELCSLWTPLWYLGLHPTHNCLVASHSRILSTKFTRRSRDLMREHGANLFGVDVAKDRASASNWGLEAFPTSGMQALSMTQSPIGEGFNLIVLDDPFKDMASAESVLYRDEIWGQWTDKLRTRLMPGGTVILIMSRWHADDMSGRAQKATLENPDGDRWETLHLPALAEPQTDVADLESWRDPIGRRYGEALWPAMWPKDKLETLRASVSLPAWLAQYQQKPATREGNMFSLADWGDIDLLPADRIMVRAWDLAGTEGGGDWTAGVLLALDLNSVTDITDNDGQIVASTYKIIVVDVRRDQVADPSKYLLDTALEDRSIYGNDVHTIVEEQPGSDGKNWAKHIVFNVLTGFPSDHVNTGGKNKTMRAKPASTQVGAGNVYILNVARDTEDGGTVWVRPEWAKDFTEEHRVFPRGDHDDQVDAFAAAFTQLVDDYRDGGGTSSYSGFGYG